MDEPFGVSIYKSRRQIHHEVHHCKRYKYILMIQVHICAQADIKTLEVPNDIGINLMELLKAEGYETIEGTCGGMALCATCHVVVTDALPSLSKPSSDELDMLETLPYIYPESRLACQIKLNEDIQQLNIEIINN